MNTPLQRGGQSQAPLCCRALGCMSLCSTQCSITQPCGTGRAGLAGAGAAGAARLVLAVQPQHIIPCVPTMWQRPSAATRLLLMWHSMAITWLPATVRGSRSWRLHSFSLPIRYQWLCGGGHRRKMGIGEAGGCRKMLSGQVTIPAAVPNPRSQGKEDEEGGTWQRETTAAGHGTVGSGIWSRVSVLGWL